MQASWLIGSRRIPSTNINVTAAAVTEGVNVPLGSYYLYDGGSSFDLLSAIETAFESHSEITSCTAVLLTSGKVRISCNVAFSVDSWSANLTLRNTLGFTGTLASAASHTAPLHSPIWWSPGAPESPDARLGTDGLPAPDVAVGQAGPGIITSTMFNTHLVNRFRWHHIENARVWTQNQANGEHFIFWREVLVKFARFKVWRNVEENPSGTTAASLSAKIPSVGAYVMRAPRGQVRYPYVRSIDPYVEHSNDVTIHVVSTPEFT